MRSRVRGAVDGLANSAGRSDRHILTGLALAGAAVAVSAAVARLTKPAPKYYEAYSDYEDPAPAEPEPAPSVFSMLWPPLFLAITLSGVRVWNAPDSGSRTRALGLWSAVQVLNSLRMSLSPGRRKGLEFAALGVSAAYLLRARRVDPMAAHLVAPSVGWIGFAGAVASDLKRKPTFH
jgi:tryptophan-rich sensory protein